MFTEGINLIPNLLRTLGDGKTIFQSWLGSCISLTKFRERYFSNQQENWMVFPTPKVLVPLFPD